MGRILKPSIKSFIRKVIFTSSPRNPNSLVCSSNDRVGNRSMGGVSESVS